MFKLYRETMEELRAPQDKLEEIIAMTEKNTKKTFSVRPLLAAAAAVAILTVGASAANLDSVQEFIYKIIAVNEVDGFRTDLETTGGDVVIFNMSQIDVNTVDGRVKLTVGDETLDITDELAQKGAYTYEKTLEGTQINVSVVGTPEQYEVKYSMDVPGGEGPAVQYTVGPDGKMEPVAVGTTEAEGEPFVSVYTAGEDGEDVKSVSIVPADGK
ncbi:MAG: hypothetical protein HFF34_02290 [Oscillospiraceae bacterium]|jgi:hypothetical protein|nr:hypothetical protein [Oscillospiraceae bacterium]